VYAIVTCDINLTPHHIDASLQCEARHHTTQNLEQKREEERERWGKKTSIRSAYRETFDISRLKKGHELAPREKGRRRRENQERVGCWRRIHFFGRRREERRKKRLLGTSLATTALGLAGSKEAWEG
jgi:hypothetical protein